jgi:hypothetical protein
VSKIVVWAVGYVILWSSDLETLLAGYFDGSREEKRSITGWHGIERTVRIETHLCDLAEREDRDVALHWRDLSAILADRKTRAANELS